MACRRQAIYPCDIHTFLAYLGENPQRVDAQDLMGSTALFGAVQRKRLTYVRLLLNLGANWNHLNKAKNTPLSEAASSGFSEAVSAFLSLRSKSSTSRRWQKDYVFALLKACRNGHIRIVRLLLQWGVRVDSKDESGYTGLMYAAECGNVQVLQLLLAHGACVITGKKDKRTVLHLAAASNKAYMARYLCGLPSTNINATDKNGHTALFVAAELGHLCTIRELLRAGADVNMIHMIHKRESWSEEVNELLSVAKHSVTPYSEPSNKRGMWAVPCAKIPAYLYHGALYQSLDKEDDSLVHVPFDCIRFRDQANNLCEFSILLRTMRFWILDRIPDGVIEYCLYHEYQDWREVALKVLGVKSSLYRDLCVIFHGEKKNRIFRAVRVNRAEIVRFLLSASVCGSQYRSIAAYAARLGKLESLRALHKIGVPWDKKMCAAAAAGGHLECLKYAHEHGCAWDERTLIVAAMRGHLGCVKYALDNDCPCHSDLYGKAAEGGHMQCVQYLVSKELPDVSITSCAYAAQGGHVDALRYLHENGCPWDENTTNAAARAGKLATLRYAIEHDCPHRPCVVSLAAIAGSVPCLRYLVETLGIHPGEIRNAFASALLAGNHACFAYLWQVGYRINDFSFLDLPFTASEKRSIARKNYDEKLRQCLVIAVRHGLRCDKHLAEFLKSHNFKSCLGICAW